MNRNRITQIVVCTAICLPALMLGAVHAQTLGVTLFVTALLFALLGRDAPVHLDFVGWIFLGLIALTAFQLVPLPLGMARALSPASVALRVDTLAITGAPQPAFVPLTVDIPATLNELAKLFGYLAVYWTIVREAKKGSVRYVLHAISVLGFVCAAVFLAHRIAMADRIYGFYMPVHKAVTGMDISAPFINPNHMAAFLGLCAFVSIGLAMDPGERQRRPWLIVFAVFTGSALFLTLSRGGIAVFITGQLVFFTMILLRNTLYRQSDRAMETGLAAWVPIGLALSLGLGMIAMGDAIVGEYVNGDASKLGIWRESLPLMKRFAVTGAGRGGFMSVFPQVSQWTASTAFIYAENVVVQVLVDYGLIFGPVILLAFLVAVGRRIVKVPIRPTTMAMVAALIALAIHNIVDFSIEIPGVAVVAVAQLAVLTASGRRKTHHRRLWQAAFPWTGQFVLAAISLLLCVAFFSSCPSKQLEAEQNRAELALETGDRAFFEADTLGRVLRRHPGAHYIVFLAGLHHFRLGDASPLPFWARSVALNPHAAGPHYYIGRFLLAHGRTDQAMLEFRLAADRDARYIDYGAVILARRVPDVKTLMGWPIHSWQKSLYYDALARYLAKSGRTDAAAILDARNVALRSPAPGALIRQAHRLAVTDTAKALTLATQLSAMAGQQKRALLLRATIYQKNGDLKKALSVLERAQGETADAPEVLRMLARLYQAAQRTDDAMGAARRLYRQSTSVAEQVRAVCFEGDLKMQAARYHSALASYKRALAMAPQDIRVIKKVLNAAKLVKDSQLAHDMRRRLGEGDTAPVAPME